MNARARLNELCAKKHLKILYTTLPKNGGFACTISINGKIIAGSPVRAQKVYAEEDAAASALLDPMFKSPKLNQSFEDTLEAVSGNVATMNLNAGISAALLGAKAVEPTIHPFRQVMMKFAAEYFLETSAKLKLNVLIDLVASREPSFIPEVSGYLIDYVNASSSYDECLANVWNKLMHLTEGNAQYTCVEDVEPFVGMCIISGVTDYFEILPIWRAQNRLLTPTICAYLRQAWNRLAEKDFIDVVANQDFTGERHFNHNIVENLLKNDLDHWNSKDDEMDLQHSSWVKDLTTEGIEPNPGPGKPQRTNRKGKATIRAEQLKEQVKQEHKAEKKQLARIENKLNNVKGVPMKGAAAKMARKFNNQNSINGVEAQIIKAIAAPYDSLPTRMSTEYTDEPTAVIRCRTDFDANWNLTTDPLALDASQMAAFLFRSAGRAMIVYDANPSAQATFYQAVLRGTYDGVIATSEVAQAYDIEVHNVEIVRLDATLPYQPHGPNQSVGLDSAGNNYFWMDKTDSLTIMCNSSFLGTNKLNFTVYSYNYDDDTKGKIVQSGSWVTGSTDPITFEPSSYAEAGYYTVDFEFSAIGGDSAIFQMFLGSPDGSHWAHKPLPHYTDIVAASGSIRVVGASMMYTNTADQLTRGGKLAMAQYGGSKSWTELITTFDNFADVQTGTRSVDAVNGVYGFLKPSGTADFEWDQDTVYKQNNLFLRFQLRTAQSFLGVMLDVSNPSGRQGVWKMGFGCEMQTQNSVFIVAPPRATIFQFQGAMEKLKKIPQWHENPSHLSDIFNAIKSGAGKLVKGIMTYGPMIMKVASTIGEFM